MQKSSPIVNLCIDINENNIIIYMGIGIQINMERPLAVILVTVVYNGIILTNMIILVTVFSRRNDDKFAICTNHNQWH